ncbi:MAG: hypothetical protein B6I29_02490 [Marinitoga sp. 4572_148]|nr:MAG: hypothetical protein B6I29_02490 [Marinitoga sp. 4572_148]
MKTINMRIITFTTVFIIMFSFSISFIMVSSFLKQNEQLDKLYENIKLTIEVINDITINDFENDIVNFYSLKTQPPFISKAENLDFYNSIFLKKIFDIYIYYLGIQDKYLFLKIRNGSNSNYLKFELDSFFDINFSKIDLDFNYFITDISGNYIYGNYDFYKKYNKNLCSGKFCKLDSFYKSSFDFFNIIDSPLFKLHVFYKPAMFNNQINYFKVYLYSVFLAFIISTIYYFFIYHFLLKKFELNKELIKNITLNSVLKSSVNYKAIKTNITEFDNFFDLFFEKINLLKAPLQNSISENKILKRKINQLEKENFAIIQFLSAFKKFLYGRYNYKTFELAFKRLIDELPFESELLKQNLSNLFNNLSLKILEIDNIKKNYYDQLETLFNVLGEISEAHEYNLNHNLIISEISLFMGQELHLDDLSLKSLYYGAKIHDLGKVFIPNEIILKKENLNSQEWNIIKNHPKYGLILLKDLVSHPFSGIGKVIISHHEKWDGTGYPYGLSDEEIPLEGRIVAIADSLMALISDKPYRKAYTFEEALSIIESESGKSYDPKLVQILIKEKETIRNIIENYNKTK